MHGRESWGNAYCFARRITLKCRTPWPAEYSNFSITNPGASTTSFSSTASDTPPAYKAILEAGRQDRSSRGLRTGEIFVLIWGRLRTEYAETGQRVQKGGFHVPDSCITLSHFACLLL